MNDLFGASKGAVFSPDRAYRYRLWRRWGAPGSPSLVVIGLNPSTADENVDDPTIRRCIGFAKQLELGGLVMLNLFAFRSTDPKGLGGVADPVGPDNDRHLMVDAGEAFYTGGRVVCAWGAHERAVERGPVVARMLRLQGVHPLCWGRTQAGHPRHPLYLPKTTALRPYEGA